MTQTGDVQIVIAEDESVLRDEISSLLQRLWPKARIVALCKNGPEAIDAIQLKRPHVAFLDIQMPGMTGIDVARRIVGLCEVVFVTAYDQYAVAAFEAEAFDYILKPVSVERMKKTLERLKLKFESASFMASEDDRLQKIIQILEHREAPPWLQLIRIKDGTDVVFVPVSEILFFKADDKYTTVQTRRKSYLMNTPLKELKGQLNPKMFWRVHRNAIVNVERIHRVARSFPNQMRIRFHDCDIEISVSRTFEHLFKPSGQ
ncbi:MAG: response regulator transcription factor [Deltaproteobacteria bacterium]|nr:response regulator transcription factor [Deltaproteobacteria bacterium]